MRTYILKGLAEGLAGVSTVQAANLEDVFKQYPLLEIARKKMKVRGNTIGSVDACDG